ncbi:DUF2207 domain-containing protein [Psychrobacillus sp. MER TA 171]|uniref:DUF2207 domain-containing protein n=1 Tax=Psychrobacillus sp. MER TA 171 TaxID=2939577 RepID=UPI00203D5DE4|nr:DUF2207 domain-containing protein [Psychrobacillus sp. MER TA 171]MCM3357690.1 DUF2207 domain-containing protein [Psychrobacillus sp. MER TA 171]
MKKFIITFLLFMVAFLSFSPIGEAKSYSIDKVHIKSWIQPNGDLLVNEVFTYTFNGSFHNLYREFPDTYNERVVDFYSYELTSLDMEPGFVGAESMIPLTVSFEEGHFRTNIKKTNEKVSYFYAYTLKNAVKTYDNYSEVKVTYFSGDAHDQAYENVIIDFILPKPLNPDTFDGFMFDRHAGNREKNQYGIRFVTPKSEAYSTTETSFYFPSSVMTAMPKIKSAQTLSGAIALEQKQFNQMLSRLDYNEMVKSLIPKVMMGMLIVAVLLIVLLPQRHFWRVDSEKNVIETDALYMFFVDQIGNTHKKSFLAGLFSLVEKGAVKVSKGKAAVRFQNDTKAPRETLEFQLVNRSLVNANFENTMIDWLFGVKNGSNKWTFNLHDVAGAARDEKRQNGYFAQRKKIFKEKQKQWELAVESEMIEAGALNNRIPLMILSIATIILAILFSIAYYADLRSIWGIVCIITVSLIYIGMLWWKKKSKRLLFLYMGFMFFASVNLVDEALLHQTNDLLLAFIVLYFTVPRNILSMNAVRAKDSIRAFRKALSKQDHTVLHKEDKWIIRAYLFKRSRQSYPLETARAVPLAGLLLTDTDPMKYVEDSWRWTKGYLFSGDGSSGGSATYSDSGGSYGGGSGDSGGGAGAD